jgi:hypothetical protein
MGSGMDAPPKPPGRRKTDLNDFSQNRLRNTIDLDIRCCAQHLDDFSRNRFEYVFHKIHSITLMGINNENDQAVRAISTNKLQTLLPFHTWPINEVVFLGSQGNSCFEVGFPLRCLQRLSRPHIATLHYRWRDNRSTGGVFNPVLSY